MEDDDIDELTSMVNVACTLTVAATTPEDRRLAAKKRKECYERIDEMLRYIAQLRHKLDQVGQQQSNWHGQHNK